MRCDQCEMVSINGVACHETGCPKSHVGTVRECDWCGSPFKPHGRGDRFCSSDCGASYYGAPVEWDADTLD